MVRWKIIRVDEECAKAIDDIWLDHQKNMKKFISKREASRILGSNYFQLKRAKKPTVVFKL